MSRRAVTFLVCMILSWISTPSQSAEISCAGSTSGPCFFAPGLLSGQISKGDYEKVVTLLRASVAKATGTQFLTEFVLNSPGGDVDEALKIGRLFRKYLITTTAPLHATAASPSQMPYLILRSMISPGNIELCRGREDCECASACALIWFGGVDRGGTVGMHRPRINDPMFKGLSPVDASNTYRQVLGRIAAYLGEMEVPKPIIETMVATSSDDIRWVDGIDDKLDRPPSIAEWEDASCGSGNNFGNVLNWNEVTQQQHDQIQNKFQCVLNLLSTHRDRLLPP